jgi:hypothetical protein
MGLAGLYGQVGEQGPRLQPFQIQLGIIVPRLPATEKEELQITHLLADPGSL